MNDVIELYESGLSIHKVSEKTGISATQVRRILQKNNVKARSLRTDFDLENVIVGRYTSGESSEHIAADLNMASSTVCRILKRYNIDIRSNSDNKRKYKIKEDFFDVIDTQPKAYLLGFMYADGNVHKQNNMIKIEVHEKDVDILNLFIDYIFIGKRPKISVDRVVYNYITITSSKLKTALISHGCGPAKTFLISLPNLPDNLLSHFIRGFYDGDGCITIDSKSNRVRVILTGYGNFLKQIQDVYNSLGINSKFISNVKGNENVGELSIGSIDDANMVLKFLYKDASIFLSRKYDLLKKASGILTEKLQPPPNYSSNLFSYNGQHVSSKWLQTQSLEERESVAKCAFEYFRKYGFPYPNYSDDELIIDFENLKKNNAKLNDKVIISTTDAGLKIFKHYCHHYYAVKSNSLPSMESAFKNDISLMKVLRNRMGITYKEYFNITGNMIRQGFRNSHTAFAASIFKPSIAKLIYDLYSPGNSTVLDISAGFGQRMLGAMASKNVKKYIGIDPWNEQIEALNKIKSRFCFENVELHNVGSENFRLDPNMIDFCFSSPPFFDKECYSEQDSQAYNKKSLGEYMEQWWKPTVKNVYDCLKDNGLFILNMSSEYIYIMLEVCKNYFKHIDTIFVRYQRKHVGADGLDNFYILQKI